MTEAVEVFEVRSGDELPPTSLQLSFQRMIMITSANRDFAPIHHDRDLARDTGAEDAYTNMMFVMAMMERTIEGWGGTRVRLRGLRGLRMVAFNRVGDTVTCRGTVADVSAAPDQVTIDLWLETSTDRRTAVATAVVQLDG